MLAASEAGGREGDVAATARATIEVREGGLARRPSNIAPPAERGRDMRLALPQGSGNFFLHGRVGEPEAEKGRWFEMEPKAAGGSVHVFTAPVVPGKEEVWRRFLQEVADSREEYGRFRQRLGIRRESVWLVPSTRGYTTVAYLEFDGGLDGVVRRLAAAEEDFDLWVKEQIAGCHGRIEPARFSPQTALDPVFSWGADSGQA